MESERREEDRQIVLSEKVWGGKENLEEWIGQAKARLEKAAKQFGGRKGEWIILSRAGREGDKSTEVCAPISFGKMGHLSHLAHLGLMGKEVPESVGIRLLERNEEV